ncbi:MAG: molybdate ABC transporter substrate-binding protein [Dehalococcoidia bacterium]|nr:molybdate ABC transporter substrate-binding protein [Dehalococcoidia bacterium]MDW8120320.1 molybdate ABC transporter substrate-binding protein [Chloroflexota bacterium]
MVKRGYLLLGALAFLVWVSGACQRSEGDIPSALTVAAAADLTFAFREMGQRFQEQTGIPVTFTFGSSGQLAHQIEYGAPVDVFASADMALVEDLVRKGLAYADTLALYARGRIGVWARPDSPLELGGLEDLARPEIRRIAIANPQHAPYGVAARQALQSVGLWDALRPKLVLGENVRQALQYAETGNADVAIVALALAVRTPGKWYLIPEEVHAPIEQGIVVVKGTRQEAQARRFVQFVLGAEGRAILQRYGFVVPHASP